MAIFLGTTGPDTRVGTAFSDRFNLGDGHDIAFGGDGGDFIFGEGGDDTLYGQNGVDFIYGDAGNDRLFGEGSNEYIYGGAGNDTIVGGDNSGNYSGISYLYGESGNDEIYMDAGTKNEVYGGTDNDIVFHTSQISFSDVIDGGTGDDTISYELKNQGMRIDLFNGRATRMSTVLFNERDSLVSFERAIGTEYKDAIIGTDTGTNYFWDGGGDDTVLGYNGSNYYFDGAGNDTLVGGTGIDYFYADTGNNKLYGGAGTSDFVNYTTIALVPTTLNSGLLYHQKLGSVYKPNGTASSVDYVYDVENFLGSRYNDLFFLDGSRALTVWGWDGDDEVSYYYATAAVTADLTAGVADIFGNRFYGVEQLYGSKFNDTLYGNDAANVLYGFSGTDRLFGRGGNDQLWAPTSTNRLIADGGSGDDFLSGNVLNDSLSGGSNNDTISGYAGNDALYGGTGLDKMTGGLGLDRFNYRAISESLANTTRDVIMDFTVGQDKIDVSRIDAKTSTPLVNDAFVLDTNGVFTAGEIRQQDLGTSILLSFYVNADTTPDMQILLQNVANPLASTSFIL